ncbi:MAG: glycosyltransferase family 2 protein [Bacteroidaceae bacterium]|nr:glycosyltransferase family 2 protein [Bacteroidaceae bacterium]
MKVTVIIVNYRVKYYLAQCLHSVVKAMEGIEGQVIVVDNDSQDDSVGFNRQLYPQVRFIENKENMGFARANNVAIRESDSEYVLLLNPDTIVNERLLRDCIDLLDGNPAIGAAGVRMLCENGWFAPESRRGVPTPFTAFCKMVGLTRLFPQSRVFGRYYMKYLDEFAATPIEIISGACMFIRRSVLNECGLLDEDFFMYGEDIDLSYRMLQTGKQNYYIPSRIMHYKGESTHKNSFRYVYVFYEAMYIFFRKHYSNYNWILSIPIRSAIYLKGASEFVSRKVKGLFEKPMTVLQYMQGARFLLKGSNRTLEAMAAICDQNHLAYDIGENQTVRYDFVVYDVDEYSYEEILEEIERKAQDKQTTVHLATYSSRLDCILTAGCVLENG